VGCEVAVLGFAVGTLHSCMLLPGSLHGECVGGGGGLSASSSVRAPQGGAQLVLGGWAVVCSLNVIIRPLLCIGVVYNIGGKHT
jgi:hypothetical protein